MSPKDTGKGAVENHPTKASGRRNGEPFHLKNQGKVYWRTIPPKEPREGVFENHLTKAASGRGSGEPSH
jgi:hypothetical protein